MSNSVALILETARIEPPRSAQTLNAAREGHPTTEVRRLEASATKWRCLPRRAGGARASFFGALGFVFAEEGFEGVGAGEIVEEAPTLFGIHIGGEEFGALFAELLEPGFVFGSELLFEFFAEALGERGVVEIAKFGDVDNVTEHAAAAGFGVKALV